VEAAERASKPQANARRPVLFRITRSWLATVYATDRRASLLPLVLLEDPFGLTPSALPVTQSGDSPLPRRS
jgi:hypothetical protein